MFLCFVIFYSAHAYQPASDYVLIIFENDNPFYVDVRIWGQILCAKMNKTSKVWNFKAVTKKAG